MQVIKALILGTLGVLAVAVTAVFSMILSGILLIPFGIGIFLWGRCGRS